MALVKADANQAVIKRAPRRRDHDAHGGSWKVAFADFCLALLCLFLVLWLIAVREQQKLAVQVKERTETVLDEGAGRMIEPLASHRGSMLERPSAPRIVELRLSKARLESGKDLAELGAMLVRLGGQLGLAGNVQWMLTPYGLRVLLHDTDGQGMFERGGAEASPRVRELLHRMGPLFASIENQMLIVGHTDSVQYAASGPAGASNWSLSSARALAARRHLMEGGMPARSVLQVVALADSAPIAEDPYAAENRRIELMILTRGQAHLVRAMFGAPGAREPLIDGASTSVPEPDQIAGLREQLRPAGP